MHSSVIDMSSLQSSSNAQHEEDVSSSHVDVEQPHMSINPSLTYSVAGISRDFHRQLGTPAHNLQEEHKVEPPQEQKSLSHRSYAGHEKPNHPRVSQQIKQGSASLFTQQPQRYAGGSNKHSFTSQMNVSIGSMSDSLNTKFLLKKAVNASQHAKRPNHQ